jgi:hypothetical protein
VEVHPIYREVGRFAGTVAGVEAEWDVVDRREAAVAWWATFGEAMLTRQALCVR